MPRRVTLVLCTTEGALLGELPPFAVATPWWPDVEPVVAEARTAFGLDVLVLRLLDAARTSERMGGDVTYLAEVVGDVPRGAPLRPTAHFDASDDDPCRAAYARPGGLAAIVAWADEVLDRHGRPRTSRPEQVKTWNLSSVLRLPTAAGPVWCKSVPPFLAHEGAAIALVGADEPGLVPPLLGSHAGTGTVLLGDVPGDDQWVAPEHRLIAMVETLVRLQAGWARRIEALLDAGLPDRRGGPLAGLLRGLVARPEVRDALEPDERTAADALVHGLPERFDRLARCGLPETLVHGDFHPGNWRADGDGPLVLLDWGDSFVGHPMLDATAFLPRVPEATQPAVRSAWAEAWRRQRPGADPEHALDLVLPVAALRQALIYQQFLDGIERTERRYHEDDVGAWIRRAVQAA